MILRLAKLFIVVPHIENGHVFGKELRPVGLCVTLPLAPVKHRTVINQIRPHSKVRQDALIRKNLVMCLSLPCET